MTRFSLILSLFFTSRLMLLMVFPPENLIVYSDYQYYFNSADMTQQGFYPFIDYWYEYPPIFPYLNIAIYIVAGQQLKNYIFLLALTLLIFDSANLYLLYRLGTILYDKKIAIELTWIYTALFIQIFFLLASFDALTCFFLLLGLYALLTDKAKTLATALGLGAMVKVIPVLLLATIWRMKGIKQASIYGLTTIMMSLVILGPFVWLNPMMTQASLRVQANKSSHQTVWALIDGNYTTGNFGPLSDHFEVEKATQPVNNPSRIPTWLTLIPFALLGLFFFSRPRKLDERLDAVIFTTLTFIIFFLWLHGWSPQWQTFLIPLLLLALPTRRAVLFIIVLGFVNFLEWPVMLSRGLNHLLPITIIIRTAIFILLSMELYGRFGKSNP
jgi:hypothetical protein